MQLNSTDTVVINLEPWYQPTDVCCICDVEVPIFHFQKNYGIPMYEDLPVPVDWQGEWGGFCACESCYGKYERGELKMWTIEGLCWATRPMPAPFPLPVFASLC